MRSFEDVLSLDELPDTVIRERKPMKLTNFYFLRETTFPSFTWEQLSLTQKLPAKPGITPGVGKPPRPKASANSRSMKQDISATLNHFMKQRSRENFPQESLSPTRETLLSTEDNKENTAAINKQADSLCGASIGFLPKVNFPSRKTTSQNHFIIRRASPVRMNADRTETGGFERGIALAFIKSSSVKYKNVVDKSRSISNDLNLPQMINDLPKISARSWVVLDVNTGDTLFGFKYAVKREVASLTKLMTLYTACRIIEQSRLNIEKFECEVSENACSKNGTSANLKLGDKLALKDLLFGKPHSTGTMLPSGNDAAQAICDALGHVCFKRLKYIDPETFRRVSIKKNTCFAKYFIDEMNYNADLLGLASSTWANPHGLMNKVNQSSAMDIALIASEGARKYSLFRDVISTRYEPVTRKYSCKILRAEESVEVEWENTHQLIEDPHFVGGKTGVTIAAGPCLSTLMSIPGSRESVAIVLLKCTRPLTAGNSMEERFSETKDIHEWVCSNYQKLKKLPASIRYLNQ